MKKVYVVADNIFSPLGRNTSLNIQALRQGKSGIQKHTGNFSTEPFYASLFGALDKSPQDKKTRFEQIVIDSARDAIQQGNIDTKSKKTGFILSTTKGNISLTEDLRAEDFSADRISLHSSAEIIAGSLGIVSRPLVISHACISGLLAIITGIRLIQSGQYDQMIISGADLITSFIYTGFQSFQAISTMPCKPFDAARDGISLGEAAATIILSLNKADNPVQLR